MSVILEFSIPATAFQLGRTLSGSPDVRVELERIVPTGEMTMPFLWVTGEDQSAFAATVRSRPAVGAVVELDRVEDRCLYRIEWAESPNGLLAGITQSDGVILEAGGGADWSFRLRFPDNGTLSGFHDYVVDHDIPIDIDRTYTLSETAEEGRLFDLSTAQYEALVLALRRGYFATPREANLAEIADELGITRQALSNRIRRANEKVLTEVLPSRAGNDL